MKTSKIYKDFLRTLAYGYDGLDCDSVEEWIDSHAGVFLKSDVSSCAFVIRRDGSEFEVDVRNFRKRDWTLLFYNRSARAVLQSLYDFLYS